MNEISTILNSQKSFFQEGNTKPIKFRLHKLRQLKQILIEKEKLIYDALKKDLNKPQEEAFLGEFMGVMHELDTSISKLKKWKKKKRKKSSLLLFPSKSFIYPEPYGNVLIISPWNYPLDLCLSPLVGAIAAGNTVILKPSEFTPHTSLLIKEFINDIFPQEFVSVQLGGADVSKALLQYRFDYIFFTGSVSVGKEIMKMAANYLTPVTLELGGKCPVIISKNFDIKKAAKNIAWGKFFNAGQSCVAPDYMLIQEDDIDEFTVHFRKFIEKFLHNKEKDFTKILNEKHFDRLTGYLNQGKIIFGGNFSRKNLFIEPTLIEPETLDSPVMQDEIFGPVLPVIRYKKSDEILEIINSREKALVIYIFSTKNSEHKYYLKNTSSGNVCINDTLLNYVNKNLPFGGVGNSGMGQYHGKASFETFSHYKSVHHKLQIDFQFRYPPYKKQYEWLRPIKNILNKNI